MTNNVEGEGLDQESRAGRAFTWRSRVQWSTVCGFIFAVVVAFLSAYWGSKYAISEQRSLYNEHAAALKEVIRFEAAQNLKTLRKSMENLREFEKGMEDFVAGNATAPPLGPGYIGLATTGLRLHLESPNAYYIPHELVGIFGLLYGRMTHYKEVRTNLDAAAVGYAAALTPAEKRRAGANLLIRIRHQLKLSEDLVNERMGLPVFLRCLDQFSDGADVCEFKARDSSEARGKP